MVQARKRRETSSLDRYPTRMELRKFYKSNNIIALLLLVYVVVTLVSTAKILDQLESYRQEQFFTGSATSSGTVGVTIIGGEGGGGGGSASGGQDGSRASLGIIFEPDSFAVALLNGESKKETLYITNVGEVTFDFSVFHNLDEELVVNPDSFSLPPGITLPLSLEFFSGVEGITGGYITFSSQGVIGYVPILIQTQSKDSIGNVDLIVDSAFKTLAPGASLLSTVHLADFNQGVLDITYLLKNTDNIVVFSDTITRSYSKATSIDRTLTVPPTLRAGTYILGVEVRQRGSLALDSTFITVSLDQDPGKASPGTLKPVIVSRQLFNSILFAIIALMILAYLIYFREKSIAKKKIEEQEKKL